jgi:pimeloyl-ACP methyl ester carboxylesterase
VTLSLTIPRILYLHGLASSPQSTKALFFGERLRGLGHEILCPDLNEDDFRGLTTTRAVTLARGVARGLTPPILIFGSSFGARVAAHAAEGLPDRVAGLVLMAPAFFFEHVWRQTLDDDARRRWQETGELPVDHPAFEGEVPLGYGFLEDALATDGLPKLPPDLPALVFHGESDAVVPFADSERFAAAHPGVRLVALDSDHELNDRHDEMWREVAPFVREHLG